MPPRLPEDDDEIPKIIDDEDEQGTSEDGDEGEGEGEGEGDGRDEGSPDDERTEENEERSGRRQEGNVERRPQRETAVVRAQRLAREARAEADKNARELAELRAEIQRVRQPPAESAEQESARLALMDPEQRSEYRFNKALENQNRQNAALYFRLQDQADKTTFVSLCAENKLYRAVKDDVEVKLSELRAKGQNVDREALAKYLLGERILKRAPKVVEQQRKVGEDRIRRQEGRPGAARSDREPETANRRNEDARRRRLEDVVF